MNVELKPCPFCGGKTRLVKKEGFGAAGGKFSRGYVSCNKCSINTPSKSPWQKAVNLWNRRSAFTNTSGDDEAPGWETPADRAKVLSLARKLWNEDQFSCAWSDENREHYIIRAAMQIGRSARPQSAAVRDEHVEPADPWLSIDSAPKDGTRIVGWGNGEARVTTHERYRKGSIGYAQGRQDTWWEYIERETCFQWKPTHWIPLPTAPALHSTQEG